MVVNMENNSTWSSTVAKAASQPWPKTYALEPRIIVPALRSSVRKDEALRLTFIVYKSSNRLRSRCYGVRSARVHFSKFRLNVRRGQPIM